MDLKIITSDQKDAYNKSVNHIVQSWQWGEFRKKLGLPVLRYGFFEKDKLIQGFELDLHQIPFLKANIGYLPKGSFPTEDLAKGLKEIGLKNNCLAIKIEPNIQSININNQESKISQSFVPAKKSLFTKHNYILDLTKTEEELLKNMHSKTRYNIKVAEKHGVFVEERSDDEAFEIYLNLYFETTKRQNYFGHSKVYHKLVWQTLKEANMAKILIAFYPQPTTLRLHSGQAHYPLPLAAWMLFNFKDTLYYPYGGSSSEYKQVMAPTLLAWQAIKYGKKLGLKTFDLWGAADPNISSDHPWYGFTRFKASLGAKQVEYIGSFDLVFNPLLFKVFNLFDQSIKLKALLLKLLKK